MTERIIPTRSVLALLVAAIALTALLVLNLIFARPRHNWDMLAYVAIAHQLAGDSPAAAHARTYGDLRTTLSAAEYDILTQADAYRTIVAHDPVAFEQQLPGYRTKIVYPWLIRQLERTGLNAFQSSVLVSKLAYIALGLVVMVWLASLFPLVAAVTAGWLLMSLPFAIDLARLSTPDALSTLLIVTAIWLAFQTRRPVAALALLVVSIAVRPDNVLWLFAVGVVLAWRGQANRIVVAAAALIGVAFELSLARWAGSPSWSTLFHHAFIENVPYQRDAPPSIHLQDFLRVYLRESHPANLPPFILLFVALGAGLFWIRKRQFGNNDQWLSLLGALAVFAVLHWMLFPDIDRFFVAAYLSIAIGWLQTGWMLELQKRSS